MPKVLDNKMKIKDEENELLPIHETRQLKGDQLGIFPNYYYFLK